MEEWILKNLDLYIVVMDSDGNIVYCNKDISDLKGLSNYMAVSDSYIEFDDSVYDVDEVSCTKDEKVYHIFSFKKAELKKSEVDELREKIKYDKLTGVLTRRGFEESLINSNMLLDKIPFSLIMCDIDDFKLVNDNLGHLVGDQVLKEVGDILVRSFRKDDIVARYGGDEFVIGIRDNDECRITERLEQVQQHLKQCHGDSKISMSFGCREYNYDLTLEKNIEDADSALYYSKTNGKNRIKFYDGDIINKKK